MTITDTFQLDARLQADTLHIGDMPLCRVLLMNDARHAWLILVPRIDGLTELDQLDREKGRHLLDEIARCSDALRASGPVDKINVGALGNIVRQLHVHVVARRRNDPAWPGPVWGHGAPEPLDTRVSSEQVRMLRERLQLAPGGASSD